MSSVATEQSAFPTVAQPELRDLYRVLLLRRNGSESLVAGDPPPFTLPCVEIPRWERVAENVTAAISNRYGITAICLFAPDLPASTTDHETVLYEVMVVREDNGAAPEGTHWMRADSFSERCFADPEDFVATTRALRQVGEFRGAKASGPFGEPGWIEQLFPWAQRELDRYGLRLTGGLQQLNASPTFSLLRLETNGPAVWFKAVGEPNLHEFPISVALSSLFPGFVPAVIATRPVWNGWLATEFPGERLDEVPDACAWERAAQGLAELQIASAAKAKELLEAGCQDLRVAVLLTLVDPFMETMSQLMEQQSKTPPLVLNRKELQKLGKEIRDTLSAWEQLNIPDTLGHLDFNPGNILCSADQCVFLDWAEAYVGPPFLTLEYLREHMMRLLSEDAGWSSDVLKAYQEKWRGIVGPEAISAVQDLVPVLAVFAFAAASAIWRNPIMQQEPKMAAYLRSLTRRMHVEMQRLHQRRQPCLN